MAYLSSNLLFILNTDNTNNNDYIVYKRASKDAFLAICLENFAYLPNLVSIFL